MATLLRGNDWLCPLIQTELNAAVVKISEGVNLTSQEVSATPSTQASPPTQTKRLRNDGSNVRVTVRHDRNEERFVQLVKFKEFNKPVLASISDSLTLIDAKFDPKATDKFATEKQKSVTNGTSGGIFHLLDFDLVFPLVGPREISVLVKKFIYRGTGGSSIIGRPEVLEKNIAIQRSLEELCAAHKRSSDKQKQKRISAANLHLGSVTESDLLQSQALYASQAVNGLTEDEHISRDSPLKKSQGEEAIVHVSPQTSKFDEQLFKNRKRGLLDLLTTTSQSVDKAVVQQHSNDEPSSAATALSKDAHVQSETHTVPEDDSKDQRPSKKRRNSVQHRESIDVELQTNPVEPSRPNLDVAKTLSDEKVANLENHSLELVRAKLELDSVHRGEFFVLNRIPPLLQRSGQYTRVPLDQAELLQKPHSWHCPAPGHSHIAGNLPVQLRHEFDSCAEGRMTYKEVTVRDVTETAAEREITPAVDEDVTMKGTDSEPDGDLETDESDHPYPGWEGSSPYNDPAKDPIPPDSSANLPEELLSPRGQNAKVLDTGRSVGSARKDENSQEHHPEAMDVDRPVQIQESSDMEIDIPKAFVPKVIKHTERKADESTTESSQRSGAQLMSPGRVRHEQKRSAQDKGISVSSEPSERFRNKGVVHDTAEGRTIYVGNLPYRTTEVELTQLFGEFVVESTQISLNRFLEPTGYGFVTVSTSTQAEHAINKLNGKIFLDHKISVQRARSTGEHAADNGSAVNAGGRPTRRRSESLRDRRAGRHSYSGNAMLQDSHSAPADSCNFVSSVSMTNHSRGSPPNLDGIHELESQQENLFQDEFVRKVSDNVDQDVVSYSTHPKSASKLSGATPLDRENPFLSSPGPSPTAKKGVKRRILEFTQNSQVEDPVTAAQRYKKEYFERVNTAIVGTISVAKASEGELFDVPEDQKINADLTETHNATSPESINASQEDGIVNESESQRQSQIMERIFASIHATKDDYEAESTSQDVVREQPHGAMGTENVAKVLIEDHAHDFGSHSIFTNSQLEAGDPRGTDREDDQDDSIAASRVRPKESFGDSQTPNVADGEQLLFEDPLRAPRATFEMPTVQQFNIADVGNGTDRQSIFERFKAAYPDYTGKEAHFLNLCRTIQDLSNLHPSLWDDFIVVHKTQYGDYVARCAEEGDRYLSYEDFYAQILGAPSHKQHIVNQATFKQILGTGPDGEASTHLDPYSKVNTWLSQKSTPKSVQKFEAKAVSQPESISRIESEPASRHDHVEQAQSLRSSGESSAHSRKDITIPASTIEKSTSQKQTEQIQHASQPKEAFASVNDSQSHKHNENDTSQTSSIMAPSAQDQARDESLRLVAEMEGVGKPYKTFAYRYRSMKIHRGVLDNIGKKEQDLQHRGVDPFKWFL